VCVCVCVRERERERESYLSFFSTDSERLGSVTKKRKYKMNERMNEQRRDCRREA